MEPDKKKQPDNIQKTFKRIFIYILIFVGLIGLTFFLVFKDQDLGEALDVYSNAKFGFVTLGLVLMLGYFAIEAWNIYSILKSFGEKITFWQAYKFTLIGFFFCSVTPGASGGQPLEIYYMTKEKISGAHATLALLIQLCGVQISVLMLGIIGLLVSLSMMESSIIWLTIIGLIINGVALAALLIGVFSKKITKKFVDFFLYVFAFFKRDKVEEKRKSINASLEQYSDSAKYIKTHQKEFWLCIGRTFLQMVVYFFIPFCVYKALGLSGTSFLQLFFLQAVLFMATSGLPLPGAIGASEAAFLSLYGLAFGEDMLGGAVLLNRSISFYWFVIVTMVVVFVNIVRLRKIKEARKDAENELKKDTQ
ncbi:flippase-like domain-containing protein [Candidatus Saccharibacteria bacterium]|nr:flippase-like domain-containing protein [Candidatus Saccharibacteria bacterium]